MGKNITVQCVVCDKQFFANEEEGINRVATLHVQEQGHDYPADFRVVAADFYTLRLVDSPVESES